MNKKLIFMYSGQGSQYYHMGKELFDSNTVFKKWMLRLDETVKGILGKSIVDIIYNNSMQKSDVFDRTLYTSPAIFMIELALTQTMLEKNIRPDYVLGASLGEISAAAVSGLLDLEDALKGLVAQSEVLEKHSGKGGMLAILHSRELFDQTPFLYENSEFTSDNFHSHFVISAQKDACDEIQGFLRKKEISFLRLPVSVAFHSSHIDGAYSYNKQIPGFRKRSSNTIQVISCMNAGQITDFPEDYFWDIIRRPILFQQTINHLEKNDENYIYLDLGPSGTLATFAKYNLLNNSNTEIYSILTPFGQDMKNFESVTEKLNNSHQSLKKPEGIKKMKTFVFPGQGAQKKGMGGDLFDEFKEETEAADAVLGYSIKELCLNDPEKLLGKTQYTQPALYVVNAFSYLKKIRETSEKPDFVAGHSLGEYNALFAAGAFDFETGLRVVKKRGELMGQANGGGMAAIIGMTESDIEAVLKKNHFNSISIANLNTPSQSVVAGPGEDIERAKKVFMDSGAGMYIPLNVSGAFHSPYMATAKEEFERFMQDIEFSEIKIPVISNVHARPYNKAKVRQTLVEQITHPVKWSESICYLMGKGEMNFEEVGQGKVLTGLISKIEKEGKPFIVPETEEMLEPETPSFVMKTDEAKVSERASTPLQAKETRAANTSGGGGSEKQIRPESLGSDEFKKDYNLKYAYVLGGMYKGIASKALVIKAAKAGLMGYFGTGGVRLDVVEETIKEIKKELSNGQSFGMNLVFNPLEAMAVDLFLKHNIQNIEAAAYMQMTPALVKYRLKGLSRKGGGGINISNRIQGKISRPEVAAQFLSPAPDRIVNKLLDTNQITSEEAELSMHVPMADDLCAEADSGGHTDQGVAFALIPAIISLRNEMMEKYAYAKRVRVGAAGGIGTPEAAAAAFLMGADFILTGSINQCTVEAGTSDSVKDLLQQINVQDTDYAPAGDMFEFGAKVQVMKKGVFFPARANKLFFLYQQYGSLDDIDENTKKQLEQRYFKRSFKDIYEECRKYYPPSEIEKAERNPKIKMAMVFKWYFGMSTEYALSGNEERKIDYQVQCGPALGAFNQWVKGSSLESWKARHVDEIGYKLMKETSELLNHRLKSL